MRLPQDVCPLWLIALRLTTNTRSSSSLNAIVLLAPSAVWLVPMSIAPTRRCTPLPEVDHPDPVLLESLCDPPEVRVIASALVPEKRVHIPPDVPHRNLFLDTCHRTVWRSPIPHVEERAVQPPYIDAHAHEGIDVVVVLDYP